MLPARLKRGRQVAMLRMSGKWLALALGVGPGDFVTVSQRGPELIIRKEVGRV